MERSYYVKFFFLISFPSFYRVKGFSKVTYNTHGANNRPIRYYGTKNIINFNLNLKKLLGMSIKERNIYFMF